MKRYKYFLICLGLLIIINFCLFKDSIFKEKENFQSTFSPIMTPTQSATYATGPISDQVSSNDDDDENDSSHFITQNPNEISDNIPISLKNKKDILNKIPEYIKTKIENNHFDINDETNDFTKRVILDKNFRRNNPELYDSIVKIILKKYLKPDIQDGLSYSLTISNEKCKDCSLSTNLVSSLSTISPDFMFELHNNLNAGSNKLGYPHPSYATLNEFKQLSTCNQDCKPSKTSRCPPVAYNCLTLNDKIG